jgi:beta-N-acetylglucosaminidase
MNVRSLPIDLLLNRTLLTSGQNQNTSTTSLSSSSFTTLLMEALLQAQLANGTNAQSNDSSSLLTSLSLLASSMGMDSSSQGLNTSSMLAPIDSGNTLVKNSSLESITTSSAELNTQLKGVLKNTGDAFVAAGKKYKINPALLASIAIHETGNGTSNAAKYKYNIAGMMGKNGLKTYDSVQESIFDMARNLRQNYLDKGKTTISLIGAKYAPVGATNDPTNLNNHWVKGVQSNYAVFTKTTDFA